MRTKFFHLDVGRNEPCPCGSGKKFKKCCIDKPWEASPELEADLLLGEHLVKEYEAKNPSPFYKPKKPIDISALAACIAFGP